MFETPHNINIIGVTSLWLLFPLCFYILYYIKSKNNVAITTIAAVWIFITCMVSYFMWKDYVPNSTFHTFDIYFARGTFMFLMYLTFFVNKHRISTRNKLLFPLGVCGFYILGCILQSYEKYDLSVWSHLMFRFIGFWWTYIQLNPVVSLNTLVITSLMYWIHILYYKYAVYTYYILEDNEYITSTKELLVIIVLCVYFMYLF